MKDLLVCIAHHHASDRLQYLLQVLKGFREYGVSHDVIVDTDAPEVLELTGESLNDGEGGVVHWSSLEHPFHLTWKHRYYFKLYIENYANFMYVEDDVHVPYANYLHYVKAFRLLWPFYVPSFVRIEKFEQPGMILPHGIKPGDAFVLDVTQRQNCHPIRFGDRLFATLNQPYHGFWIMPQHELRQSMTSDFTTPTDSRELAASYPMWDLHKTPVVEIEHVAGRYRIKPECFAYHLPNNYAPCKESPFAKIKVQEVFL